MNTDHAYTIGSTHNVCQDYAVSNNEHGYAFVSDGCSGSPNSQIGAMILCNIAGNYISRRIPISNKELTAIIHKADFIIESLGANKLCLDATLFGVFKYSNYIGTVGTGDGYIIERREGMMIVHKMTANHGYPLYLSYRLDPSRLEFITEDISKAKYTYEVYENHDSCITSSKASFQRSMLDITVETKGLQSISVLSDGVEHIIDHDGKQVPTHIILEKLTNFKNTRGLFVQRRLNGFKRQAKINGWTCEDDISIASIHL
jgi:hypothetical protein